MRPHHTWPLVVSSLLAAACAGGDGGGGPGGGASPFTARVDGQAWAAAAGTVQVTGSGTPTRQGMLLISGHDLDRGITLALAISYFTGPASQPLGVNPASTPGGTGTVTAGASTWMTPFDGASGFVTLTARTSDRIAGTFHFDAAALLPGTMPAARTVTDGAFDITVPGGLPPLPTGVGSTALATVGGQPWYAATIVGAHPAAGVFSVGADNTEYSLSFLSQVPVSAGNTYGIPSQVQLQVIRTGTTDSWYGGLGGDVGTLTLTELGADRLRATFSATLPALNASGPLAVTGGALNVHVGP